MRCKAQEADWCEGVFRQVFRPSNQKRLPTPLFSAGGNAEDAYLEAVHRPRPTLHILKDEPDNRILECAIASQAEFIVSEDHHLLALKHQANITMISLADFLAKLPR